jgi:hypothetical protein
MAAQAPLLSNSFILIPDPQASRFLAHDSSIKIVDQNRYLEGYELYIVEQWACSRSDPTCVITAYTGQSAHRIKVDILSIPHHEKDWGQRLIWYSQFLRKFDARTRKTELGLILTSTLASLPPSLTTILIPDGEVLRHRLDFFINENLKRLQCLGRVGISLSKPTRPTETRFYRQYHVSDKIPLDKAVITLAQMCQTALMLFGLLDSEYTDGLICDKTEQAVTDWWLQFGSEYYSFEPQHTVIDPTTVPALIGLLIGARNRLYAYGAPVSKDVFDLESTKRAIAYFQKDNHLPRSRRLDRQTLQKLHKTTAKAVSEGYLVRQGVRSTLAELGRTHDERAARGRSGIADIETVNFEEFIQHVYGSTAKYLWQGKMKLDHGNEVSILPRTTETTHDSPSEHSVVDGEEREQPRKLVKRPPDQVVNNRKQESNRRLGRIKDVVNLRHGHSRTSEPDELGYAEQIDPPSDIDLALGNLEPFAPSPFSVPSEPSIAGSVYRGVDLGDLFEETHDAYPPALERSRSYSDFEHFQSTSGLKFVSFPRRLSFSVAEEDLSSWANSKEKDAALGVKDTIESARRLRDFLHYLEQNVAKWVKHQVNDAEELDSLLYQDQARVGTHLFTQTEIYRELKRTLDEAQEGDREQLAEIIKDIELLSEQLEFEINLLRVHVEDVEAAVNEFESNVIALEDLVAQMEKDMEPKETWYQWIRRMFIFVSRVDPSTTS